MVLTTGRLSEGSLSNRSSVSGRLSDCSRSESPTGYGAADDMAPSTHVDDNCKKNDPIQTHFKLILLFIFLFSGVSQPIIIELIHYQGACEKSTFLYLIPNYIGMMMVPLADLGSLSRGKVIWWKLVAVTTIDVIAQGMTYFGLVLAGSAVFTVVYSSVTVWTALQSRMFLRRRLQSNQWVGCFLVTAGISLTAISSKSDGKDTLWGALIVLLGSALHSSTYVFNEFLLVREARPLSASALSFYMGALGLVAWGAYTLAYTVPHWDALVAQPVRAAHGSLWVILPAYLALAVVNALHAGAFFQLLGGIGSVSTGVVKGVQAVTVFAVSHVLYCHLQQSQCFSYPKGAALIVVVFGVMLYSLDLTKWTKAKWKKNPAGVGYEGIQLENIDNSV
uniref:Sugar phosphate transporter domain-containing protein n=1 Tax=Fibrocapsa japonica TaxID=94617 RepID=A0A7S2UVC2_9STRA|mmetsp:Transcript_11747/g.17364  ORF Transcript_11747/g.17364 Transcript_11747/m.17364 type:complete len:392 (+) Transcript_11747:85-1260(+)